MPQSTLSRSFTLSLLLHAGLLGLLFLAASRAPVFSDTPLRVRILEAPGPPQPASREPVQTSREPRAESREGSAERRAPSAERREPRAERREGRQSAERSRGTSTPDLREPPAAVPPRVAARPTPQPAPPRPERTPEAPRETMALVPPEQSGLRLGGPTQAAPRLPAIKAEPPGSGPRPSLRDQIASLGSGLTGDAGELARQTVNLNSREDRFVDYLAQVKRRVERVWVYPEEALAHGVGGELLLVFTLNKGGTLTNIRLVQSSGFPILDEEALRAVKLAAPFDPFPSQMGDEPWNISASFHYNLPRRFRRN
ncbi:MAG: energy transducer TonB [candidate division NC10 bacterium]|nr:energy transducer TonB [candidate division NC10 bacterium]